MFALSLLSGGLFLLPVIVTVGIFIGTEYQALFQGKGEVGSGWLGVGGGSGPRISIETYCQKLYGITPDPGRYVFNPNQWGDPDNSGALCMNITVDRGASSSDLYAAEYSTTWSYPQGPEAAPVHAFPNAALAEKNGTLPVQVSSVKSLFLDMSWTYGLGSEIANTTDHLALEAANVNANVAVDMFAAEKLSEASNTTAADYEVMVWFGRYGLATMPIGWMKGSQATVEINSTTFDLFWGENNLQQRVFTWVASANTTEFVGDLEPLVTSLAAQSGPSPDSYIGYIAFGTEALYSVQNVTFYNPRLQIDFVTS